MEKIRRRSEVCVLFLILSVVVVVESFLPPSVVVHQPPQPPQQQHRHYHHSIRRSSEEYPRWSLQIKNSKHDVHDNEASCRAPSIVAAGGGGVGRRRRRKRQIRRKPQNRRPKYYWTLPQNLRRELVQFWFHHANYTYNHEGDDDDDDDDDDNTMLVLIPNEMILQYFHRHDIRAAIASQGGRDVLAQIIPARIMPGRWEQAIQQCYSQSMEVDQLPELRALLSFQQTQQIAQQHPESVNLQTWSASTTTTAYNNNNNNFDPAPATTTTSNHNKWSHNKEHRKPKGYWNLTVVIEELYDYVDGVGLEHDRPAVWMPRPNEMTASGRDDLKQAMQRFGGSKQICRIAGMIPFREWYYFEGLLELLKLLKQYLDEFANGQYHVFPTVTEIRQKSSLANNNNNGGGEYETLHSLIQYYGGRKALASRLGMDGHCTGEISYGPFDLEFSIRLLEFVRNDLLQKQPPLSSPHIWMPSQTKLLKATTATATTDNINNLEEGKYLHQKIMEFGGYENVARRLGLAYFKFQ